MVSRLMARSLLTAAVIVSVGLSRPSNADNKTVTPVNGITSGPTIMQILANNSQPGADGSTTPASYSTSAVVSSSRFSNLNFGGASALQPINPVLGGNFGAGDTGNSPQFSAGLMSVRAPSVPEPGLYQIGLAFTLVGLAFVRRRRTIRNAS